MKKFRKIFINLLIITLFSCLGGVIFAHPTKPLAGDYHRQGSTREEYYNRLENEVKEIANSDSPDNQKQRIQEIFVEYVYRGRQMPSVEPEFILELCSIISRISNPEIRLLIFTKILFPLLHMQLIYDETKANFWSHREIERGDNYTFSQRIWCDLYRALKSKRGVCRNFTSVVKVILDKIKIQNILVYSGDHIFNAYLFNEDLQWKVCDLTCGITGENIDLFPSSEGANQRSYLDLFTSIHVIPVGHDDYRRPYKHVVYCPSAYLQVNFDLAQNRRTIVAVINDGPTFRKFPRDIRLLFFRTWV